MTKAVLNAGVPLYASAFVTNDIFVVGGGGGQGAHGVANKILVYKLHRNGKAEQNDEIVLPKNSDTVTSIASCDHKTVWVGANVPQANKQIKHLRKLEIDDKGKFTTEKEESFDLFQATDISVYQRTTSASGSMVAATNSSVPATVCVISTAQNDVARMNFNGELIGAALADYDEKEHKFVAAVSESNVEVRVISKPEVEWATLPAPADHKWSRVESVGPARFVAASTVGARKGAYLTVFSVRDDSKIKVDRTIRIPGFKGVTALASSRQFVAVASPSGDVYLYDVDSGKLIKKLRGVHNFPVTSLAVSPSGTSVISTSLDGSLAVFTGLRSGSLALGWLSLLAAVAAFVALVYTYITTHNLDSLKAAIPFSQHPTHHPGFIVGNLNVEHGMGHGPAIQSSLPLRGETHSDKHVEHHTEEPQIPEPTTSDPQTTEFTEVHSKQPAEPLTPDEPESTEPASAEHAEPAAEPAEQVETAEEPANLTDDSATEHSESVYQAAAAEQREPIAHENDRVENAKPQPIEAVEPTAEHARNTQVDSEATNQPESTEHANADPVGNANPQQAEPAEAQPAGAAEPMDEQSSQSSEPEAAASATETVVEHVKVIKHVEDVKHVEL